MEVFGLALRAGFPAAVHPDPLIGIPADLIAEGFVHHLRIDLDVFFHVPGLGPFQGRVNVNDEFAVRPMVIEAGANVLLGHQSQVGDA